MAYESLTPEILKDIIDILSPFMGGEADRRALLLRALIGSPVLDRIDYSGPVANFVPRLVETLRAHGNAAPGRTALWALLETLRGQVGENVRARIDALYGTVNAGDAASAPGETAGPPVNLSALPQVVGAFQGRIDELEALGEYLTAGQPPRVVTLYGAGGQGKTALAREAAGHFAYAWPGGVYAVSLESLPTRESFAAELARMLRIPTGSEPDNIEQRALSVLENNARALLLLDNAETLVQAVSGGGSEARRLAALLRERLPGTVSLLVTSRQRLNWPGEQAVAVGGLAADAGARLFAQSAADRAGEIDLDAACDLSRRVDGHALGLRLLGAAFAETPHPLAQFIADYEARLLAAEDIYKDEDDRHRTLYACFEVSVQPLPGDLRDLLGGLWVFHAPFLPETAVEIFDPDAGDAGASPVQDRLHGLWRRGLLERQVHETPDEGKATMYRLLPALRPYVQNYLPPALDDETLLARFGAAYAALASHIYDEQDRSPRAIYIAQQASADLTRGIEHTEGETKGYYLLHWGRVLGRLGDNVQGLKLTQEALKLAESGKHQRLQLEAMNNMALVYYATGKPAEALALYEQALPIRREVGDRAGEATTL
ncbi:MAG: tetratricopeptide repeat protein, partial [Anaerolineae bacterium]|nr:tetratricopeptide repeat protein [Anaerolineae bacterium]